MPSTNEKIQFRLIQMPCCNILLCWVNPRRPNYCPECGTRIFHYFPNDRWNSQFSEAWLRVLDYTKATYIIDGASLLKSIEEDDHEV
jgi:hypothetical protein